MVAVVAHPENQSVRWRAALRWLMALTGCGLLLCGGMSLLGVATLAWANDRDGALLMLLGGALLVCLSGLCLLLHRLNDYRSRHQLLENITDMVPSALFYKDTEGRYCYVNQLARDWLQQDPIGKTDYELFPPQSSDLHQQMDKDALDAGKVLFNEEWISLPGGQRMLLETSRVPFVCDQGLSRGVVGIARDITEARRMQTNLEHIAHHDPLTGLANRTLLTRKFDYLLRLARRRSESVAVLFVDLDRFRDINDSIGHDVGDLLLQDVARRLHASVRDSDLCARLGGDEFVLVLPDIGNVDDLQRKVHQLMAVVAESYDLKGHQLSIACSVGACRFPQDGNDVETLIRHADTALHKAKEMGRGQYYLYDASLTDSMYSRMTLEQDLRLAVRSGQFTLVYQPQFRFGELRPRRVEALLRWHHPMRGQVSPMEFIPVAETVGLIGELGLWVLRQACEQFLQWQQQGLMLEKIAVNVSAIQVGSGFADQVMEVLQQLDFDPACLELEITESALMSGITEVTRQINRLRAHGIEFSIDDFGTGYSSLSKIKSMPVSVLKIDQSFVRDINDDINDYEIARAVILMAKSLGLTVVAEGVENQAQENTLQRLGCDWLQGYLYGLPLSGEQLMACYR